MSDIWQIPGRAMDAASLGALEPEEVLLDVDGPRLYVTLLPNGERALAYQCAEDCDRIGWLVVPTDALSIDRLRRGDIALSLALAQPWIWFVEQSGHGVIRVVRRIEIGDVPSRYLPVKWITLPPEKEPLLEVRVTGAALRSALVPASVVRRTVDGAMHAMKVLVEHALQSVAVAGPPKEWLRRYYDLPIERFAFGSFEVTFGDPSVPEHESVLPRERDALQQVAATLRHGIARVVERTLDQHATEPDLEVALEALAGLLPPASGAVEEVYLGGWLVGDRVHVRFDREHSRSVRKARLRNQRELVLERLVGEVREFDKDALSFTLRSHDLTIDRACGFPVALYEDAFAAFTEAYPVVVVGHQRRDGKILDVLALEPAPENGTSINQETP